MGISFNADDIFNVAERAEENGARFYRRAAELQSDRADVAWLLGLAAMEDQHKVIFATMRERLTDEMREPTVFDPYLEATMYLNAEADTHGGEGTTAVVESLTGNESMEEILRTAITLEETSIVYYMGMKDFVPEHLGKHRIDAIIAEEQGHIVTLVAELKKLKKLKKA